MPLTNKLVTVTRTVAGNHLWKTYLETEGAQVYSLPTIELVPLPLTTETIAILKGLSDFDWLVLTSATSVRYLQALAKQAGVSLSSAAVAAVGEQTARAARVAGLHVAYQPAEANSTSLGMELTPIRGTHILLPRTTSASTELITLLRDRGGEVTSLPLYETHSVDEPDERFAYLLQNNLVDYLTFASPSAVRGFSKRVAPTHLQKAHQLPAIAIGPEVAAVLANAGFTHVYTSNTPSVEGIVKTLKQLPRYRDK